MAPKVKEDKGTVPVGASAWGDIFCCTLRLRVFTDAWVGGLSGRANSEGQGSQGDAFETRHFCSC
jgi:hypothetical protein